MRALIFAVLSATHLVTSTIAMEPESPSKEGRSNELTPSSQMIPTAALSPIKRAQIPTPKNKQILIETFNSQGENFELTGGYLMGYGARSTVKPNVAEDLIAKSAEEFNALQDMTLSLQLAYEELLQAYELQRHQLEAVKMQSEGKDFMIEGLKAQLNSAKQDPQNTETLLRTIKEAQERADEEARAKAEVAQQLETAKAREVAALERAKFLKTKEEELLSKVQERDATIILNQEREKLLMTEVEDLKRVQQEHEKNKRRLKELEDENADYKQLQEQYQVQTNKIEEQASIKRVAEENEAEILKLRSEIESLQRQEEEKEGRIGQLKKAVEAHDPYSMIKGKILDSDVKDDPLALYMWSVMNQSGQDLDELSDGQPIRLIELIINVSQPEGERPLDTPEGKYKDRFRLLGNKFVERGLAWKGVPFNMDDCTYKASQFARDSSRLAEMARAELTKK